ncbi:hypothetical protein GCM10010446_12670 [Streptomyces enissocaesilis]|uniref:Uncharacterized protein n=1 Tax=Streptomyces enissocaesilis TaxID=332589 RepID=A0ABN3WX27_9ACTN
MPDQLVHDPASFKEWLHTGRIKCADCNATVVTENLTSLPPHRCTQRQAARAARLRAEGNPDA